MDDPTTLATSPQVRDPDTTRILVLAPERYRSRVDVAANLVAAVRPDLAVHVLLSPDSLAVRLAAIDVAAQVTIPNEVVARIAAALERTVWGAWLPSVARLSSPSPTVAQHAMSLFNRAGFIAVHTAGSGWVEKLPLQSLAPERRLVRSGTAGAEAVSFGELPEQAIKVLFDMGVASRPQVRGELGDAAEVWGTPRGVEFVVRQRPMHPGEPTGQCRVCRDPVWSDYCPFCCSAVSSGRSDLPSSQGAT